MAGISLFGVHDFDYLLLLRVVVYLLTLGTLTATSSTRRLNTMSLSLTSRLMNGPIASDYHHATEIEPRLTSAFLSSSDSDRPPRIVLPFSWINRESCSPRPAKISRLRDLHFENWLIIPKIRNIVDTSSSWSREGGEEDGRRKIYMRRRGEKFRLNGSRSGGDTTRMMDSRQLWRQHGIVLPTDGKHWLIAAVLV